MNGETGGNFAAMREAAEKTKATLEEALQILNGISDEEAGKLNARIEDAADAICEVTQCIIPGALAAPPRNCDRFGGDNAKLQKVYYSERGKEYDPRDHYSRQAYLVGYGNWLLAPAMEKGSAKC